jgi:hypothetical protein
MARKRYKKKRADYRKGGRVRFDAGGIGDDWKSAGLLSRAGSGRYYSTPTQINRAMTREETDKQSAEGGYDPGDAFRVGTGVPLSADQTRKTVTTTLPYGAGSSMGAQTVGASGAYIGGSSASSADLAQGNPVANTAGYTGGPVGGQGASRTPSRVTGKIAMPETTNTMPVPEKTVISRENTKQAVEEILEAGKIPDPVKVDENIKGQTTTIQDRPDAVAGQADRVIVDPAATGVSTQAQQQAPIDTETMEASKITDPADVTAATGTVGEDSIAEAAQVERIDPIQAAKVEIPEGALTERITGTLSPQATAQAAQAAGTTLSRVTRAKKQLRNSGMSEEAINALGNDPEDLEDRLMDLTERERGVIGDLPEEALVSNQLDSLLKGMESGEIPVWARPALSSVEQILAERGLEASTVGRDALFNAIIQSAIPLAQSNAQAIQASVAQTRDIESREELTNVQLRQQTALQNASNVFQMDMAQFSADQQTALSNSKFLQTVGLTEASNEQQAIIQNAMLASQANLAEANFSQQAQIANAKAFLAMDMANLNNEQQASVLNAQLEQQALLSNQSAENAARQFNAVSENQTKQFMAKLAQQVELSNADRMDKMTIANTAAINARAARQAAIDADLAKANAFLITDINKKNQEYEFRRDNFNATNAAAVEASNVAWRRNANTINTAAANTIAMQNAMNAFNLGRDELAFLWQEARDNASFIHQSRERGLDRENAITLQVLVNDANAATSAANNQSNNRRLFYNKVLDSIFTKKENKPLFK